MPLDKWRDIATIKDMELFSNLPESVRKIALNVSEFLFAEKAARSCEIDTADGVTGTAKKLGLADEQFLAILILDGVKYFAMFDPRFGWQGGLQA